MRRLILPTCLLMSAWAPAAGPLLETVPSENLVNVTVVEKSAGANRASVRAPVPLDSLEVQAPAETTEQAMALSGEAQPGGVPPVEAAIAEMPFVPLPPRRAIPHQIVCEELALAAADNNLPAPFLIKLINQESGFNQNAVSRAGAQGVAQFMPETAAQMRLDDPFDPLQAVRASAQLLRNLLEQFGNKLGLAAAAYNAGPRRVQDWLAKRGKLPQETRDYVQRITGRNAEEWKANMVAAQFRVPAHAPCQHQAGLFAYNGPQIIPLPQAHPGSEHVKVAARNAAGPKNGTAKPIVLAGADAKTALPAATPRSTPHATRPNNAKAKAATVTIATKRRAKAGQRRTLQVAEAHGQK
jgi:hypothetical protein